MCSNLKHNFLLRLWSYGHIEKTKEITLASLCFVLFFLFKSRSTLENQGLNRSKAVWKVDTYFEETEHHTKWCPKTRSMPYTFRWCGQRNSEPNNHTCTGHTTEHDYWNVRSRLTFQNRITFWESLTQKSKLERNLARYKENWLNMIRFMKN